MRTLTKIIAKLTLTITFTLAAFFLASTIFVNASPISVPSFYADAPETSTCSTPLDRLENCITQKLSAEIENKFPTDNTVAATNARTILIRQIIADSANDPAQKMNVENILTNANAHPICAKNAVLHYVKYSKISYKNDLYDVMTKHSATALKNTNLRLLENNLTVCTYEI